MCKGKKVQYNKQLFIRVDNKFAVQVYGNKLVYLDDFRFTDDHYEHKHLILFN